MLHAVLGLVAVVLGVIGVISWWQDFGLVMRGLVPFLLVVVGLIALGSGLSLSNRETDESEEAAGSP